MIVRRCRTLALYPMRDTEAKPAGKQRGGQRANAEIRGHGLGATAIVTGVIWVIAQRLARWLIRDMEAKRAARAARAAKHKGNGRE